MIKSLPFPTFNQRYLNGLISYEKRQLVKFNEKIIIRHITHNLVLVTVRLRQIRKNYRITIKLETIRWFTEH